MLEMKANTFQSTLSVRRATIFHFDVVEDVVISIHALRKKSDVSPGRMSFVPYNFNPRSP